MRPVCLDKWSNTSEPIARRQIAENAGVTPDCPEVTQFDSTWCRSQSSQQFGEYGKAVSIASSCDRFHSFTGSMHSSVSFLTLLTARLTS